VRPNPTWSGLSRRLQGDYARDVSKYDPLRTWLATAPRPVEISFDQIDKMIGGLPPSAHLYSAWWANERVGQHVQARAWMESGRRVEGVDLRTKRVRFV
jgi:hypothetical protein